ncbi:hypothetical protein [uncultured Corynebacterium sp.]|uniref:hypothetical protein n=1 Tax=uncultured Corynebacterium sp. TaxID=159447 RepID=UPI0026247378|nr:hypothetical protein [uncultured Corynebacterium sp.]
MSGNGTPKSLRISIIIVATALVVVIGIAIGLSLNINNAPKQPEVPSASQGTTSKSTQSPSPSTTTSKSSETSSSTSSTTSTPSTTTSSEPTSTSAGQDFGTGRSDLDGLGFVRSSARCDSGDRAFAVIATEQSIKAAACETRSGEKYYRSDTPQGSGSMEIIVDEGDRIVARNGSYKYQMSPDGLLVTKDNVIIKKYAAEAWGTA